jgi:excisionase family DNA binding protein
MKMPLMATTPSTDGRLLVDQREAARLLSLSTRTVYLMSKDGRLPCLRIGRSVRYSPVDLAAWIAANSSARPAGTAEAKD